jgi:hypothetical protein
VSQYDVQIDRLLDSQWSQPLNLSQVLERNLGLEHGRSYIVEKRIISKYIGVYGEGEFFSGVL